MGISVIKDNKIKIIDNRVTLMCPECIKSKTVDLSKQVFHAFPIKINAKCPCGHVFMAQLEKRRFDRINITLPGVYIRRRDGLEMTREAITLRNISLGGVGFESENSKIVVGENLLIVFYLNDGTQSLIKSGIIVKFVDQNYVGAKFTSDKYREIINDYIHSTMVKNKDFSRLAN